jgi:arylsulfatase A-like enzyme
MDTTRRDHVSLYGYPRRTTPNLEELAKDAAVYDDAWSLSNWTPASHATMFTGLLPAQHGVDGEAQPPFECDVARLPQVLHDAGYATGGFPANPNLLARGWERGFDDYHAPWVRGSHTWIALLNTLIDAHGDGWIFQHSTRRVLALARDWWAGHSDRPRFLFVNLIDPHFPYRPPLPCYERFLPGTPIAAAEAVEQSPVRWFLHPGLTATERERVTALYDGELAALDEELGSFFDWLRRRGELDPAIVCVTADHGERLGERGMLGHDVFPDPTLLRVPLIARFPAKIAAERVTRRVQLDGLPGQILRWAGLDGPDAPGAMMERNLDEPGTPIVRAQLAEPRGFIERVLIEHPGADVSSLRGDLAFVCDGRFAWTGSSAAPDAPGVLVDLRNDPESTRDVSADHPDVVATLARIGRRLTAFPAKRASEPRDPADEERLRASGYVAESK